MLNRAKLELLVGETARDIGILLTVFAPLDALYQERSGGVVLPILLTMVGLCMIVGGIIFQAGEERSR